MQQATLGHRGRAADPLYTTRKRFLLGAERVDRAGWRKLRTAWRDGDPDGEVFDCWLAKEKVRDVSLTDDVVEAQRALDDALDWCSAAGTSKELRRLARTLRRLLARGLTRDAAPVTRLRARPNSVA